MTTDVMKEFRWPNLVKQFIATIITHFPVLSSMTESLTVFPTHSWLCRVVAVTPSSNLKVFWN